MINLLSIIIILFVLSNTKGEDTETSNKQEEVQEIEVDLEYKDDGIPIKNHLIDLRDYNFDSKVKDGNDNRWLILFTAETCSFCKKVKSLINKIVDDKKYKIVNNIQFGIVDIDYNLRTRIRFNLTKIPVIMLVENNTMVELSNFPNYDAFVKNIETVNLTELTRVKAFPKKQSIYEFKKGVVVMALNDGASMANKFLKNKNINYQLTGTSFFLIASGVPSLVGSLIVIIIFFCCCRKRKQIIIQKGIINGIEKEKMKDENRENSEENKKLMEEMKEKENEEKMNKEKEEKNFSEDKNGNNKKKKKE